MSRFRKLSPAVWHCQYHLVWTPKYRFRMLTGEFWAEGYCADTIGLDAEKIRWYVKYQEQQERQAEQRQQRLF